MSYKINDFEYIDIVFMKKLSRKCDYKEHFTVIIDGFTKVELLEYTTFLDAFLNVVCLFDTKSDYY